MRGSGSSYLAECLWCRMPLPVQTAGAPRKYCEAGSCQKDHLASRWADYLGRLKTSALTSPVDEEMYDGFLIYVGGDKPLSFSPLARRDNAWKLDGRTDFNPKMYLAEDGSMPEWLTFFLEDFPPAGADPGMTQSREFMYAMDLEKDERMWCTKGESGR